jgi:hypothetical protein
VKSALAFGLGLGLGHVSGWLSAHVYYAWSLYAHIRRSYR